MPHVGNYGKKSIQSSFFEEPEIDKMIEDYPYFTKLTLSKDFYPFLSNNSDIETLSIKTVLMATSETPITSFIPLPKKFTKT